MLEILQNHNKDNRLLVFQGKKLVHLCMISYISLCISLVDYCNVLLFIVSVVKIINWK